MTSDITSFVKAIEWLGDRLRLLDQRLLPQTEEYLELRDAPGVARAIKDMVVRGAPAIGIAAAYGVVLSVAQYRDQPSWREKLARDIDILETSRPTAVNLRWALMRLRKILNAVHEDYYEALLKEALLIHREDLAANLKMAEVGASLLQAGSRVLTHCNTGALATGGHGTALGVIRTAWAAGKISQVYAGETRPWLQGARLTAWELQRENIPVALLCDGAAASLMREVKIDWVIVGADRIVANGDVANKIGTYSLAVAARHHGAKFMVAAPCSTFDSTIAEGGAIPIEHRPAEEITRIGGVPVGAPGVAAWNPVFDVTPAGLVDVLVTEKGLIERPDADKIRRFLE
jgi:methylthioribose-1-phosphate isomerase